MNVCDPKYQTFSFSNINSFKENKMHEEINQVQSDVHLYEDFISSSMYLQDFDEIFQPKHLGAITQDILDNIKETN